MINTKLLRTFIGALLGTLILGGANILRLINYPEDGWGSFTLICISGAILGGYLGYTRKTWEELNDLYNH